MRNYIYRTLQGQIHIRLWRAFMCVSRACMGTLSYVSVGSRYSISYVLKTFFF